MKNFIIGALIISVAVLVGLGFVSEAVKNQQLNIGASSGPDHYNKEFFHNGLAQGGGIVALTSAANVAMTSSDVCDNSYMTWTPTSSVSKATAITPVAQTINDRCIPQNGMFIDRIYRNTAAAVGSTTIFSASTGVTIYQNTATGTNQISGGYGAWLRFVRVTTSTIHLFITPMQ